jgi:hypothetical protein
MFTTAEGFEYMFRTAGGVAVTYGVLVTWGLLDVADENMLGPQGAVYGAKMALTIYTGALGNIANGAVINAGGTAYTVRDVRRMDDGALSMLLLGNA